MNPSIGKSGGTALLGYVMLIPLMCGCSEPRPEPPQVAPPVGPLLYQPAFVWSTRKTSHQGTGFLAKTTRGKIVGVTSAHFIDFDGPVLLGAAWLDVTTGKPVARFRRSHGPPGRHPQANPIDLRMDYLLLCDEDIPLDLPILELDLRLLPDRRERIWFPDKDNAASGPDGYKLVSGTVEAAFETHSVVRFDDPIKLQSQSGSPIISQKTGKVIGTLSQGGEDKKGVFIYLTPSHALVTAMRTASDEPLLKDVVGRAEVAEPTSQTAP